MQPAWFLAGQVLKTYNIASHSGAGPRSAIGRAPDSEVRRSGFDTRSSSPSADSRRAVVYYWRKYVHEVLVNLSRSTVAQC